MKTKPGSGGTLSTGASSGSSRSHSKRGSGSRERDRDRDKLKLTVSGESGASSQCDTPPLTEKEWSAGKMAGVGSESVMCAAEQAGTEISGEAAAALAEDVSFKLRQLIHSVSVHSQLARRARVDTEDVDSVLRLMDTEPVLGPNPPVWQPLPDDYCYEPDSPLITRELALASQTYTPAAPPALTVHWVSDERSLGGSAEINPALRNYCTHISRALLKGSRKVKEVALEDLATNPRIGPILPNLFNLAVLVLNDENLNTLHVPVKEPLKHIVLDMMEALCANPCSLDTDVQKQLQRLYPALVSDILGSGPLADKMITVVTKLARTWPAFVHIGEKTLYDYLRDGHSERVSGAVVCCLVALGRRALLRCLEPHLDYVDTCMHAPARALHNQIDLTGAMLEASWLLLRPEPDSYLEDQVTIDYALYEMIGDSILPRRILSFPSGTSSEESKTPAESHQDEDIVLYTPVRTVAHRPKIVILAPQPRTTYYHRDTVFEPTTLRLPHISLNIKGSRPRPIVLHGQRRNVFNDYNSYGRSSSNEVVAASGYLSRFTYKLPKRTVCPIFAGYTL